MPKIQPTKKHRTLLIVGIAALAGIALFTLSSNSRTPVLVGTQPEVANAQLPLYILSQFKGESTNPTQTALVRRVGEAIATRTFAKDNPKKLRFHLLAEPILINAFALPTGDVYVTTALVNRMRTEGELAAALSTGVAHALVSDRPIVTGGVLTYSTAQETAADVTTVKLMAAAGYDPNAYLGFYAVLTDAYQTRANVPYFATHPSAQWRLDTIKNNIATLYPKGVPAVLSK